MAYLARHGNVSPLDFDLMLHRDTLALHKHLRKIVEAESEDDWKRTELLMKAMGAVPR